MEKIFSLVIVVIGLFVMISKEPLNKNEWRAKFWIGLLGEKGAIIINRILGAVIFVIGMLGLLGVINILGKK